MPDKNEAVRSSEGEDGASIAIRAKGAMEYVGTYDEKRMDAEYVVGLIMGGNWPKIREWVERRLGPVSSPQPERPQPEGEDEREWTIMAGLQGYAEVAMGSGPNPHGEYVSVVPKSQLEAQRQRADEAEAKAEKWHSAWVALGNELDSERVRLQAEKTQLREESERERAGAKEMIEAMGRRLKVAEDALREILAVGINEPHEPNAGLAKRLARQALTALNEKPEGER